MLANQRLCVFVLRVHVFQLAEALLELLARRGVLGHCSDQLHVVQTGLLVQVEQQLNNLVELV